MRRSSTSQKPTTACTSQRRGGVTVETAIVLPIVLLMIFATLDTALVVQRQNLLTECACRAARLLIVSGEFSTNAHGPAAWSGKASDNHPICNKVRQILKTLDPAKVNIQATWPDGNTNVGSRVNLQLVSQTPTVMSRLFGQTWVIRAQSTMLISY